MLNRLVYFVVEIYCSVIYKYIYYEGHKIKISNCIEDGNNIYYLTRADNTVQLMNKNNPLYSFSITCAGDDTARLLYCSKKDNDYYYTN